MSAFGFLTGELVPVPDPADLPVEHLPWCFGCGGENDHGLGIRPRCEGNKVVAELVFAPRFQGGPGVVHGGATAAFFDDLMGFVMMAHRRPAVTARLEVNYLRPIPLGLTLRGEAWLAAREERKLWAEAVGMDGDGHYYVEARALFVPVGVEHYARSTPESEPDQLIRIRDQGS